MPAQPEHIKKFYRLRKKLKKLLDTHRLHHSKAYTEAAEALLLDEEGNIDYEKLEDIKIQDQFIDKMIDFYLSKAKQTFKGIKPKDEIEEDMMLKAYGTHTRGRLTREVRKMGKDYSIEHHEGLGESLIKQLGEELGPTTSAHLKKEHINDIIKYTQTQDIVDKEKIRIEETPELLGIYEKFGVVPEKMIEKAIYYKKKKKTA